MVTTGARSTESEQSTAPPQVEYWVHFRRGDSHGGPAYTGTYGFDWVEWKRNSANNPATAYDDLVSVMGKPISNYKQCYNPGLPGTPAQPAMPAPAAQPASTAPAATPAQPAPADVTGADTSLATMQPIPVVVSVPKSPPLPTTLPTVARPAIPGVLPSYAAVKGLYKEHYRQELHKGYTKSTVQGNDYYLPWCSVRPHQPIQLKLEVKFLNKEDVQTTNRFTVAPHADYLVTINGQTNNGGPMNLVPKNKQVLDVTIECLHPSAETSLKVVDENNKVVGELQLAENLYVYELPLRVVYVVPGVPNNTLAVPNGFHAPAGALAALQQQFAALSSQGADLLTFLNQHSLNQALISCSFQHPVKPYELLMNLKQWETDGFYSPANKTMLNDKDLHGYCVGLVNVAFGPTFAAFRGITLYVCFFNIPRDPVTNELYAADGSHKPVDATTLLIYRAGLEKGRASTVAHELGHVLGLTHSFPMLPAGTEDDQIREALNVRDVKRVILPQQIANLASDIIKAATPPTPAEQKSILDQQESIAIAQKQVVEASAELDMFAKNAFKFTRGSTSNLMDYVAADTRCSFWHWQWWLLQADVASYYGTKSAAL